MRRNCKNINFLVGTIRFLLVFCVLVLCLFVMDGVHCIIFVMSLFVFRLLLRLFVHFLAETKPKNIFTSYHKTSLATASCATVRRPMSGYDSDGDQQTYPEPKPDYTDDDFEVETVKKSPKKKGPAFCADTFCARVF